MRTLDDSAWSQLLLDARTHNSWASRPVEDTTLRRLYELARMGPTAMNCQPVRLVGRAVAAAGGPLPGGGP